MKKLAVVLLTGVMSVSLLAGTAFAAPSDADIEAAQKAADLIDMIYVQNRTEETDDQCSAAKEAWDSLTDTQKELVEGINADPDYFGRDTGDASSDDPGNGDDIGEAEILVVSFGTSFNDSRVADIKSIEDAVQEAFPEWSVRRAFTSQIIINHIQARDGEFIDNMEQALERAAANGVRRLVVQPTHLMHGAEFDEMCDTLAGYEDSFEVIMIAEPLLGPVGKDASVINEDKQKTACAVVEDVLAEAGLESTEEAAEQSIAIVLFGHGTSHTAKVSYNQMITQMDELGYDNVFVGTVEGEPEATSIESIIEQVREAGYKTIILRPLMVVAGDHANNDMAGDDEDSWKSILEGEGFEVVPQIKGLGSIPAIRDIYIEHTKSAVDQIG